MRDEVFNKVQSKAQADEVCNFFASPIGQVERVRGFEIGESTDEPESRGAGSPRRRCLIFFMSFMV